MKVASLKRLGHRPIQLPGAEATAIETGCLGFLGAAEEDRQRWLGNFRRLLDGLDAPLQVVMAFVPGAGADQQPEPHLLGPASAAEMRASDLAFAANLADRTAAQRRSVTLVTTPRSAARVALAVTEIPVEVRSLAPASADPLASYGNEAADCHCDLRGFHRTWYVDRLPGLELEPGWLRRLAPDDLHCAVSWHAEPLPAAWVVDFLQRQLINMRATRLKGSSDPSLDGALPNAEALQRRLAASQESAFHVSVYVTLSAPTRQQLEIGAQAIKAQARSTLCVLQPTTFRMRDGRLATLPLGIDRLLRRRVLDTSSLTTFFPWLDAELQHEEGLVLGSSRATRRPVLVDPFDDRKFANANIGVFGHSGAGKTYLLSAIAMGALGRSIQVFVIDPEHEYGGLAERLGGIDVRLALGSGHSLNVLELRDAAASGEEALGPAVADAVDLCAVLCGGLDESERADLELAVRSALEAVAQPVLGDVARLLARGSRLERILTRWTQGSLGRLFSAATNVDLDARIVVFGMRELREEMVAPVHFLLAEALWGRIRTRRRRTMLLIDELGLLFEDPAIRRFTVALARRIRKYNGSLVFATQNPGDLLTTDAGAVVATNPAIHLFGAQRPGEALKLQQAFHLSDEQRVSLETARRGDFLLAAGPERLSIRVEAPAWQVGAMRPIRSPSRS